MQPDDDISGEDIVRLEHILEAAEDLVAFVRGRRREDLDADAMLRRAVCHAVMVIGEASARTSLDARLRLPELSWVQMVATRNVLVHVYWGVDLEILWKVAIDRAPELVAAVKPLLQRYSE